MARLQNPEMAIRHFSKRRAQRLICGDGLARVFLPAMTIQDALATMKIRSFEEDCGYETLCWTWVGARTGIIGRFTKGYGTIMINRKVFKLHRLSFEHHHGPIPDGLGVCHKCHNSLCWRPDHLYADTNQSNTAEATRLGRMGPGTWGENSPSAKLTNEQVVYIRENYIPGRGPYDPGNAGELARRFGVCVSTITLITSRKTWVRLT